MINLRKSGHILYVSSVDISIGNGPGVNEREFILALYREIKDRAHFLIPQPAHEIAELPDNVCTFSAGHQEHNPRYFPGHVLSTMRLADQILTSRHFDLLVFRLDLMPFAPLKIIKKHNIPFALKTLGQGQMKAIKERFGWPLGSALARVNQHLVQQLVKNAIAVDTVSEMQLHYLQQMLDIEPDTIICIDNAVNTKRFFPTSTSAARNELGLNQFEPIIGYIGNHAAHKRGGAQLIEVVPMLLEKYPNLGVVILGDINGSQSLIDLAHNLEIEEHCVFTGYVPFHQVPTYVNALDVGISLLAPKFYGQSELKVRQYVACGKPVIATMPGSNDFLFSEDLGSLVQYDDINSIAMEVDRWLSLTENDQLRFSARSFQYAQDHLSVEQSLAKRIALWNERINLFAYT
ncbi:MAG: glycosyltransferase family 4 protein [Candidatus Promineifilaceae bacterium]|nr:glycosyltransferase family 4 protein [Candidatus Promineifilaceae bacterium]